MTNIPPPPTALPQYRPPVQHVHTSHKTYYDHFDDREQRILLVAMKNVVDEYAAARNLILVKGTYYEFVEKCRLENGFVEHDCDTYG